MKMLKEILSADAHRLYPSDAPIVLKLRRRLSLYFRFIYFLRVSELCCKSNCAFIKLMGKFSNKIYSYYARKLGMSVTHCTEIGRGILFEHRFGTVIASSAKIGDGCTIFQNVTIGRTYGKNSGAPKIGNRCILFAGAKIIGSITLGDDVIVGAGAVVINDVPSGCVVAGCPAKIVSEESQSIISKEWRSLLYGY